MGTENLLGRFLAYAQAFESTYADDDWTRLEPFFAPDAVYRVLGSQGWDCVVEGRENIFRAIKKFLDEFDRHCAREIKPGSSPPSVEGDVVRVAGVALYRRGASDELKLEIELMAEYRDGLIVALSDVYPVSTGVHMKAWMKRWGAGLKPSYV
ncbi:MAG TPA: nuclear transport factor 2 family protein [Candidatus Binatia bacterium]|jgi:hypothetical protein|nr:nuclear transport factor 2 family protein [Candidatus Binatia bacterium]